MMFRKTMTGLALLAAAGGVQAQDATVDFLAIPGGPAGVSVPTFTFQLLLSGTGEERGTGDLDVFVSGDYTITAPASGYYNDQFGSDNDAPNPLLIPTFPDLAFDTFVDSPGSTQILRAFGDEDLSTGDSIQYGDLTADAPLASEVIAQFTLLDFDPLTELGRVAGRISVEGPGVQGTVDVPFDFTYGIPEPTTAGIVGLMGLGLLARRRQA